MYGTYYVCHLVFDFFFYSSSSNLCRYTLLILCDVILLLNFYCFLIEYFIFLIEFGIFPLQNAFLGKFHFYSNTLKDMNENVSFLLREKWQNFS